MITAELKEIERLTVLNGGSNSFDTWGDSVRTMFFFYLMNNFREKKLNYFSGEKWNYIVYFRHGNSGRGGMDMGSPDSMVIERVNQFKEY
jgi:hypothetical protein